MTRKQALHLHKLYAAIHEVIRDFGPPEQCNQADTTFGVLLSACLVEITERLEGVFDVQQRGRKPVPDEEGDA